MTIMTRTQLRLPTRMLEALRAKADELGISVSELIRRLVDEGLSK